MGEILLAEVVGAHGFERRVVLKGLLERLAEDPVSRALFLREARLMARLDHPNIVRVFDLPNLDGRPFLAMELVRGRNLHQTIQQGRSRTPHPLRLRLHVMAEALRGLHYAHTLRSGEGRRLGLVHRDVSPGNILVSYYGEVKLTDFGIARVEGSRRFTAPKSIRGKARYVAPELVRGGEATVLSDIYSAGVVLAEALLEGPLWTGESVAEVLLAIVGEDRERTLDRVLRGFPEVTGLRSALRGALAIEPTDRFASALQFAEVLDAVAARLGPRVSPTELGLAQRRLFEGNPDVPVDDGFGRSGYPTPDFSAEARPEAPVTVSTLVEPGLDEPTLSEPRALPGGADTFPMSAEEVRDITDGSPIGPFEVPLSQPMIERASLGQSPSRNRLRARPARDEDAVLPFADTLAKARAAMAERPTSLPPGTAPLPPEREPSRVPPGSRRPSPLWPRPSSPPPLPPSRRSGSLERAAEALARAVASSAQWVAPIPNRSITVQSSPAIPPPSRLPVPFGIALGGVLAVAGAVIALLTTP